MMDEMEHKESTIVFNAMIKALGSRTDVILNPIRSTPKEH